MARIEGTQNIPAEWLDLYRATLTEKLPTGAARKRFPFRLKHFQKGGNKVTDAQLEQRSRFEAIRDKFKNVSWANRQRWYAARPPWNSILWYYNYFMLSGLMGNAFVGDKGGGVIKTIQVMKASVPTTGTHVFTLPVSVDAAKTVIMIQGSARKVPRVLRGSGSVATGGSTLNLGATIDPAKCSITLNGDAAIEGAGGNFASVEPYVSALSSTQISIAWARTPDAAADIGWQVTEHVEGAVYPVLVSVSDTQVTIDWAEVPDAAAEVSITAIEYI